MNLDSLTIEQKVGQLFLLSHSSLNVSGDLINLISKYHIGGITYTGHQKYHPKKFAQFTNTVQKYCPKQAPLFISINEDNIQSIEEMINIPNKLALGAIDNRLYSKKIARIVAKQLSNLGFNMILSPHLNIYKNEVTELYTLFPFGENVNKVKKHATDMIQGFQSEKVIPITNLFPSIEDGERVHPVSEQSLLPFMYAFQQGIDVFMISHVEGASISTQVIQEGIRKKIGYDGIVMVDSGNILSENNQYDLPEATILALKAGVDLIYLNDSLNNQLSTIDAVIKAVKTGELKEEKINESIRRILHVKTKHQLNELPTYQRELMSQNKHIKFAKKLSEQSVTIIQNEQQMLPLKRDKKTVILTPPSYNKSKYNKTMPIQWQLFSDFFHGELRDFITHPLNMSEKMLQACEEADQIILPISHLTVETEFSQLTKDFSQQYDDKLIVCAFGNPFDLLKLENAATLVLAYDTSPMSLQTMAKVLLTKQRTRAKLPLYLSDKWKIGHQAK